MTWVAAAVASVAVTAGAIQAISGAQQKKKGRAMEALAKANKPQFRIPPEIAKNMSQAEMMSYHGLPDEQKQAFLDNQQRASQAALRSSGERRGGLGMISQIQSQQDRSSLGLLQQDVAARNANIDRAMQARGVMASYRDKRFEHQYNEYAADLDYARAMIGAGMQNVSGGLSTAAQGAQSFAGSFDSFQGKGGGGKGGIKGRKGDPGINYTTLDSGAEGITDLSDPSMMSRAMDTDYLGMNPNQQKRKAREMFRQMDAGDTTVDREEAFSWITTNLYSGNEAVSMGDLASQYGGKRFGKRWSGRASDISTMTYVNPWAEE